MLTAFGRGGSAIAIAGVAVLWGWGVLACLPPTQPPGPEVRAPEGGDPWAALAAVDGELPCPPQPAPAMPQDSLTMLGLGFWQLCTDKAEAAIATFEALLAADPAFAEGFDVDANLGHALRRKGDWDAAIAVYERVVARGGDPASGAHAALAALQTLQGHPRSTPTADPNAPVP